MRATQLPQARIDLVERGRAGAQVLFAQRIERLLHRREVVVQILGVGLDVEQAGDDLSLGRMLLEKTQRRGAVVDLVIGGDLAQRQLGSVMLLDDLDRAGLVFDLDRHAARNEVEPV